MTKKNIPSILLKSLNQVLEEMTFMHVETLKEHQSIPNLTTVKIEFTCTYKGTLYLSLEQPLVKTLFKTVFPDKKATTKFKKDFIKETTQSITGLFLNEFYPDEDYSLTAATITDNLNLKTNASIQFITVEGLKGEIKLILH